MLKLKLKTSEMLQLFACLDRLAGIKFPTKGSYSISRALAKLKPDLDTFNKAKEKLFEQYGRKRDNGDMEVPRTAPEGASKDEKEKIEAAFKEFESEMKELQEAEIEVEVPYILLGNLGDVSVEPALLYGVDKLLVEEPPQ